jgi:hypothetical protein
VLARRNDEVISRYFEELQRRQRGKGPENYMTNFCSRGLASHSNYLMAYRRR